MGCVFGKTGRPVGRERRKEFDGDDGGEVESVKGGGGVEASQTQVVAVSQNGTGNGNENEENEEDEATSVRKHRKRSSRPNPRLSNPPKNVHGEQVAAGWPSWLSAVAGEAINGWTPRRADTFEKLDKVKKEK